MTRKITLSAVEIESISLDHCWNAASQEEFSAPSGQHYKLLALLAKKLGGVSPDAHFIDVGTHLGDSSLALSVWGHRVTSFDVEQRRETWRDRSNVKYVIADLWHEATRDFWRDDILSSTMIFIDIDPHEGKRELEFIRWLQKNEYKGIIVLDDIWFFKEMRDNCWYRIEPYWKVDVTRLGHWSGTGIVTFNQTIEVDAVAAPKTSNWTLVTGYFDLTSKQDANDAIRARPQCHYIDQHGTSVLSMDQNLIVFCDPNLEEKIWSMRPRWLHYKTRVIPMSFEEFSVYAQLPKIIENRGNNGACGRDPRNTASYYLFCMSRYEMLLKAISLNPFGSTHFAWINICIERMGFSNLIHLPGALALNRARFSTCWIDYVSKNTVENLKQYFGAQGCKDCQARCTMCSGFFTGRIDFMTEVCSMLLDKFNECVAAGVGHADEQLYPMVYHAHPELFDWYLGDYAQMITNYELVREAPENPLHNLIRNSYTKNDWAVCQRACDILAQSIATGACQLNQSDANFFATIQQDIGRTDESVAAPDPEPVIRPLPFTGVNADATSYVCTTPTEGIAQLSVLKSLGCQPSHKVLEIGCGALVAGYPIMQYLDPENYSGIDPNDWLRNVSLSMADVIRVATEKRPSFSNGLNFRTGIDAKFDFIVSHSILSHASSSQLDEFIVAAKEQLNPGGVCAASIRLAEGNRFGSPGSDVHGEHFQEWVYPGVSWFRTQDVITRAAHHGMHARVAPELTEIITSANPKAVHDWLVMRPIQTLFVTAFFRLDDRPVDEDSLFLLFDQLADSGVEFALFLDRRLAHRAPRKNNVTVILTDLDTLLKSIRPNSQFVLPGGRTPRKDTEKFLLLQNAKIQLLDQAFLLFINAGNTHYAWIDFAILKIAKNKEAFLNKIAFIGSRLPAGVHTPGCWGKQDAIDEHIVNWRFCGGFFTVDYAHVEGLATWNRELLGASKVLTWEVNNWAKLEQAGVDFGWYAADHDDSILG